jgi:DNA-binding MarR family transcriptional regulator
MVEEPLETVIARAATLTAIADGPTRRADLAATLGVSGSTVDRAVRELSTHGLATRGGDAVVATTAGRLAARSLDRLRMDLSATFAAGSLLAHLPPDCGVDERLLAGATVREVAPPAPYRAADGVREMFQVGERLYALSAALTDDRGPRITRAAVLERGATYRAVYAADVAAFLRAEQAAECRRMAATGRYRAFVTDGLPFGLFVRDPGPTWPAGSTDTAGVDGGRPDEPGPLASDGPTGEAAGSSPDRDGDAGPERTAAAPDEGGPPRVALAAYDDEADLRAVLYNDTDAAVAWARETFRRIRAEARNVTDEFRSGASESPRG